MFIKGMDVSSYPETVDKGFGFYDFDGNEVNILDFAKEQGFNYGRLRIWNDPPKNADGRCYCDLAHTRRMAREIKSRGMGLLLDFHYSDWWADPGNQKKPHAWEALTGAALADAVYAYTKEVLTALDADGTYPDMVQVGNEIRCGMLWPDGHTGNWDCLAQLLNAGIRGVRDTQKGRDTKIMLHLDQGGRFYYFREWFDNAIARGVTDFDVIGLSYYPFWHGAFYDLKNTMESLASRYQKQLVIAEMAHAYRRMEGSFFGAAQETLAGFPAGGEGQRDVCELLMGITAHISGGKGLGVFYWEPFSRAEDDNDKDAWGSCMSLVDMEGRPMDGVRAFGCDPYRLDADRIAKIYEPDCITVTEQDDPADYLPRTVKVLRCDGSLTKEDVEWAFDKSSLVKNNICVINGILRDCGRTVRLPVKLVEQKECENLIQNGSFEVVYEGTPDQWEVAVETTQGYFLGEVRQDVMEVFPFDTSSYYFFQSDANFRLDIGQTVKGARAGAYSFSLLYRGDNTTGVNVKLYAREGGNEICAKQIYPSDEDWVCHTLEFAYSGEGDLKVGLYVDAPAMYGKIKDVRLGR